MSRLRASVVVGWSALAPCAAFQAPSAEPAASREPALRFVATEHVGRLTGTRANPIADVGLAGTDLGVSFEVGNELVFLFGDSWTVDGKERDLDSAAVAPRAPLPKTGVPELEWLVRPKARASDPERFLGLAPRGKTLGGMEVPVEGVSIGGTTYVFFDGGWDPKSGRHARSLLAHAKGTKLDALELDHDVASAKFLNVSVVVEGTTAWIFGTGHYRKSAVYLARVDSADIADRAKWRYAPSFEAGEERALPIVEGNDLGELSVRRLESASLWLLGANASSPRGIQLRTARDPRGPWSDPIVIVDPERDAYGRFMHRSTKDAGFDDGLSERGRENEWGGEYGPYLVPAWFESPAPGVHAIAYVLSSWNPYQVHVMRTWLAEPGVAWTPTARTKARVGGELANARFEHATKGWTSSGDAFAVVKREDGSFELCTYVPPRKDAVQGALGQDFVVPSDAKELTFLVHGGTQSVRLVHEGDVVRETRGPRTNDVELRARWNLEALRGERVRLEIVDTSSEPWGFVTVRAFELVR